VGSRVVGVVTGAFEGRAVGCTDGEGVGLAVG